MYQKDLEQLIGQMLMIGISGDFLSLQASEELSSYNIGGVGLFNVCPAPKQSNITSPEQLKKLCKDIQACNSTPFFISIDQEGGKVARLNEKNGFNRPLSPQNMAISQTVSSEYHQIGRILRENGVNFNFSPCIDVNINPENPIIGALGRSFSSDHTVVFRSGLEAWQAQKSEGVLSCLKHFPGHGSSSSDTHLGVSDITLSHKEEELLPFIQLIEHGFDEFILTAHVIHQKYSSLPASLSIEYSKMLRSWGFKGLIITDDLKMGALEKHFSLEDTLILAVNAGADILAYFNNLAPYKPNFLKESMKILVNAVHMKKISEQQIIDSASRISSFKKKRLLH
ncbi:MAG: glycoside hydrolase family 3 N-terminal domain-containing protein [Brevinema sp.]